MLPEFDTKKNAFTFSGNTAPLRQWNTELKKWDDQPLEGPSITEVVEERLGVASTFVSFVPNAGSEAKQIKSRHPDAVHQEGDDAFDPANAKPNPGGVEHACRRAKVHKQRVLMITARCPEDPEAAAHSLVHRIAADELFSGQVLASERILVPGMPGYVPNKTAKAENFGDKDAVRVNMQRAHPWSDSHTSNLKWG